MHTYGRSLRLKILSKQDRYKMYDDDDDDDDDKNNNNNNNNFKKLW